MMNYSSISRTILLFVFILLLNYEPAQSQNVGSYYNPKDDQYRLLGLKRAKELFENARSEFERQKLLFEKELISQREFESAKSVFADAEVNYQQALLAVIFEKQYVSVLSAVKYQGKDGKKHVRLKLGNTSAGGEEFQKLINVDDKLFRSLQPEIVSDVYVSLLNDQNAIISLPYEAKVEEIKYGEPVTIDFILLQDLDAVTVNIIYGSGTQRAPKIFLQKDESEDKVFLQSEQFSQEVELGASATYNMSLELFSGSTNTFKLEVVNLPKEVQRYFVDQTTSARISQFKFTETSQTRNAGLQIFLPDRTTEGIKIAAPIKFYVIAIPYDRINEFKDLDNEIYSIEEIEKLNVGYLRLELIPRGTGKLLVKSPQLFFSITPGNQVEVPFTIYNEGTKRLDNVEFDIDLPLNWTKAVEPEIISTVNVREEKIVKIKIIPPSDVSPGKYDVRVRTSSLSESQIIKAEDKTVTVEIKQETNILFTLFIIVLIIGIIGGIVVFGIKIMRK